jgi:phosphatidylglycerophosphate synthase
MAIDKGYKTEHVDIVDKTIMHYFCKPIAPLFYLTGHTANSISIYGFIFTIGSLYYLCLNDMLRFTLYFWIAYFLDCLDGYYARIYNMVSSKGDVFEHLRDIISLILMLIICCVKYIINQRIKLIIILANLAVGMHVGCTQKEHINRNYFETLDLLQVLCFNNTIASWTPYYGVGLYMLTLNIIIIYLSEGVMFLFKICFIITGGIYFIGKWRNGIDKLHNKNNGIIKIPVKSLDISRNDF